MLIEEEVIANRKQQGNEAAAAKSSLGQRVRDGIANGVLELGDLVLEFVTKMLFADKVQLCLPKDLAERDLDAEEPKTPGQGPQVNFSNDNGSVTAAVSHTPTPLDDDHIGQFKEYMILSLQRKQPEVKIIQQGIQKVHDKPVAYFEFISPAKNGRDYNLMFMVELENRALVTEFHCPEEGLALWQPIARSIMETLELNAATAEKEA